MTVDAVSNEIVTSRRHLTEADMEWAKQVMENPEKYKGLVVRVAGYSAYFTELNPELQIDLINRTELSFD